MDQTYNNNIMDLAKAIGITEETDVTRLLTRCSFDSNGYLVRLTLNGFDITGDIDISKYTKHLSSLDVRNNPELGSIKISAFSPLAYAINHDFKSSCFETLKTDDQQAIAISGMDHDSNESPFIGYFSNSVNETREEVNARPFNTVDSLEKNIENISEQDLTADLNAIKEELKTEKNMLYAALSGEYFTRRLQNNLDRTEIGFMNKGLAPLRALAQRFENASFIEDQIWQIRNEIKPNATITEISSLCKDKADSFWKKEVGGYDLAPQLQPDVDKIKMNTRNLGEEGAKTLKGLKNNNESINAYYAIRDNYISGAKYGKSNLRLSISRYAALSDELQKNIEKTNNDIRIIEDEMILRQEIKKNNLTPQIIEKPEEEKPQTISDNTEIENDEYDFDIVDDD
ncbi:MAG: hypothetical protein K6B74_13880 [Ruminococcus sp.]|nr:hypothetical protein [Ruminococcus sp.]